MNNVLNPDPRQSRAPVYQRWSCERRYGERCPIRMLVRTTHRLTKSISETLQHVLASSAP